MYVSEIKQRLPSASVIVTHSCLTGRCTLGPGFFHIQIYAVRGLPAPVSVGSSEPDSHLSDLTINGLWNSYACFVSLSRRLADRYIDTLNGLTSWVVRRPLQHA
ncbi:hypothetical protein E4U25_004900 [Claviceps purpurea]|nr:hypothetical protein E4U25_004900 [Claviceps purpurea]